MNSTQTPYFQAALCGLLALAPACNEPPECLQENCPGATGTNTSTTTTTTETTTETTATNTATDTKPGTDSDSDSTSSTTTTIETDSTTTEDPICGNTIVEEGEDCDDGNTEFDKECPADCKYHCGDGIAHGDPEDDGEECDNGDGNGPGKACSSECTFNICGNGNMDKDEECDNGDENADDAACTSECKSARCGDSLVRLAGDDPEQCDDGKNLDDLDGCTDECKLRYTVFVTSETYQGDLGKQDEDERTGLDLADLRCQQLAEAAGWKNSKFRAWLSDSTDSPSTRFETAPGFEGTFALPDGTEVAVGWTGLTTADDMVNLLLHAIDMDENGDKPQMNRGVWSNTTATGMKKQENPEYHCLDWTSADMGEFGHRGSTNNYVDKQWTDFLGSAPCDTNNRLYCFQVTHP